MKNMFGTKETNLKMLSDNGTIFTLLSEINKTMTIFKFYSFKNLPVENTAQLLDPTKATRHNLPTPICCSAGSLRQAGNSL